METKRLKIYVASTDEMKGFIQKQKDQILKKAYTEMLENSIANPERREWYAMWMIELKNGTHIGELCFKGIGENGFTEIGYGISDEYRGNGYATEAVSAVVAYALKKPFIRAVFAELENDNVASKKVLTKCGFIRSEKQGHEGPIYIKEKIMQEDIIIRLEKPEDYRKTENLVRESFWNVYRPGCLEHYVLKNLRNDKDFIPELDFVMEKDGKIIGQNIFVKTVVKADDGRDIPIMTMGPICIAPDFKRQGYGKMLLDYSLKKAKEFGCKAVCFEGNIDFYGKSGFRYAREFGIRYHGLPEGEDDSFFLAIELEKGYFDNVTGEYSTPKGYFVGFENPEAFENYDATFPKKEKLKLPGQLE